MQIREIKSEQKRDIKSVQKRGKQCLYYIINVISFCNILLLFSQIMTIIFLNRKW